MRMACRPRIASTFGKGRMGAPLPISFAAPQNRTYGKGDHHGENVPMHEIAAAIAAAREPVGVRGKRSREHR